MNTDLIITFKTALTLCIDAALKLNQLLNFYCTAIIIQTTPLNSLIGNTFNITDEYLANLLLFGS